MKIVRTRAILALGSLAGLAWGGTWAAFTDQATGTSTFTAGTVDILLANQIDDAYAFTSLQLSNMKPGDEKYAPLEVKNNGSLAFTYGMGTGATNADSKNLAGSMTLGVRKVALATDCNATGYGAATDIPVADTTALGSASFSARTGPAASGGTEILCFHAKLGSAAPDSVQGGTTAATFTFTATNS
jgi:predicted ribosomally synthesized peptide with SipW-like signal peptide